MKYIPKHHGVGPQRRGAQCSCIGYIGLRPALAAVMLHIWYAIAFQFDSHLVDFPFLFFLLFAKLSKVYA